MPSETLVNGKNFILKFQSGKDALVTIKRLTIRQVYEFVEYASKDQTPELVALCADQEVDWVNSLTDESFGELAEYCINENFRRAMTLGQKDPVIAARLAPVIRKMDELSKLASQMRGTGGRTTNVSSPAPAPTESAAATGNASSTSPSAG